MPDLRLSVSLLMRPTRPAPKHPRDGETWWSLYGRAVRWFSAMYGFVAAILGLIIIVNPAEGMAALQRVGIAVGIYIVVLGPLAAIYIKRDGH